MLDKFIWGILNHRKMVVSGFVGLALVCACMIPFVSTNYDMVKYLPPDTQSTHAVAIMDEDFSQAMPNANVLVNDVSVAEAQVIKEEIASLDGVEMVLWLDDMVDLAKPVETLDAATVEQYYRDGSAMYQVSIADGEEGTTVPAIRDLVDSYGEGNGVAGEAADNQAMMEGTVTQVGLAVALVVPIITILLILSTMSWIEPILFYAAIGVSILINMGTNLFLGGVSFITFAVSPILQLAVSLDYAIFLLHAFAEHRKTAASTEEAMALAMRQSVSTIAASAVTTLFGFMALSFMQFQIGADLGFNLVKGVVLSFIAVVVFLPALTVLVAKYLDKTTHRKFMPDFSNVGKPLGKIRIPAMILCFVLMVPAFLGQGNVAFTYLTSEPDPELRYGADYYAMEEAFGQQNAAVLLVPRGDVAAETALSNEIEQLEYVKSVMSFASTVGAAIPNEFLEPAVIEQFYSDDWARIIAYIDAEVESDESFGTVQSMQDLAAQHYDEYYMAGQSANLYDMAQIIEVDNVRVSMIAIVTIFLVVALTFRSLMLPVCLVLAIETGIWINLCIPYYAGDTLNFIGYLIINTVQLGATIDYGILLTTHYLRRRKEMPARQAIYKALGETVPSLIVSAGILASAGFALGVTSDIAVVALLGFLLARGALISLVMVT
ncbi:MAG: MMPL family transporter, partial [Eggerthellaceae bacterium]|nr:MMPL family transporter [Eggerthellaceae bacterium]